MKHIEGRFFMEIKNIKFVFNDQLTFSGSQLLSDPQELGTIEYSTITESTSDGIGDIELGVIVSPRKFRLNFEVARVSADTLARYFRRNKKHVLKIGDRKINCTCTRVTINNEDGYYIDPILNLEFIANDPYFYDVSDFGKNLAGISPQFKFPYTVTKQKPLIFGYYLFSDRTIFTNNGDEEVGLKVVFKAKGAATNITFKNLKTGKYLKINNLSLKVGDIVTISTLRGDKYVTKYDAETKETTNIFAQLDRLSEFFYLEIGENLLSYEAETGQTNLEVYLYYVPMYVNGWHVE